MDLSKIRIGNQTCCNVPAQVPYEFVIHHKFNSFEWFSDKGRFGWCEDDTSIIKRAELHSATMKHGIKFSVHAPHAANPTTQSGTEAILKSIRFGGDIGADVVNVHMFPGHKTKQFAESLLPLLELGHRMGIRISLENTPQTSPDHFNAVFGVLSGMGLGADIIGMCLDSGHANLFEGTHNNYLEFIDQLGKHVPIIHWHVHENWGDRDSHLPLFTGPSSADDSGLWGLIQRLKQRKFEGSVVFEQWPNPPEMLLETRRRLEKMMSEA